MRWNFKQNTDKSWTITNTEGNFLYGIDNNNGIRVGATEDKWTITAHSGNSMTWSFKNGKSRFLGVYNNSDWRSYKSLTASNFGEKGKNSQVILYYCGSISSLPSLEMPIVAAETRNTNSVYVSWNAIDGAKDYTVTCGTQSITLSGTEHTFTGLAYSTSYTISVVANPTDASVNAPSAAGTASITTGANPSSGKVTFGDDWNALFATSYNGAFNPKANELSLNGEKNGVSINVTNGTSINGYIKKTDFRAYNGYTIMLSAPEGKSITAVSTTKGGKAFTTGIKADKGTGSISNNTFSWKGSVQSLKLTISGTVSFATIDVTYE